MPEPALAQKELPIPEGPLTGDQIAGMIYEITHGALIKNAVSKRHKKEIAMVVSRAPSEKRKPGRRPVINT
ncbi:MAG: hypothetical protein EP297_11490, partial [Gammaproteobacteria bacterium]